MQGIERDVNYMSGSRSRRRIEYLRGKLMDTLYGERL